MKKNKINNVKQVKFLPYNENFYFSIIEGVRLNKKLPDMSISKQARNHYINKLKSDGILIKRGYSVWDINEDKATQFKFIEKINKVKQVKFLPKATTQHLSKTFTSLKDKRGHAFILTFSIPRVDNWYKREEFLIKNNIEYKKVGLKDSGLRIVVNDHKIHLFKSKIILYSPSGMSYFSSTAQDSQKYALYDMLQVFKRLEGILSVSLKIDGQYKFKVSRQHYGKVNDNLANMYKRDGKRLYVANDKGVWLITDDSFNLSETETIDKDTSPVDMDNIIVPFFNSLKAQYENTGEIFRVDTLMQMQYSNFKVQQQMSRNIEELTSALQKIEKIIKNM